MQSATGLSLDAVIIEFRCAQRKTILSRRLKFNLLNFIFGFLCSVTIKIIFLIKKISPKLPPAGTGMYHLSVPEKISAGLNTHLLFTIYDLLFTIIILKANRRVFNK